MSIQPQHNESASTKQRTTLDLAVATIPSLVTGGVAIASLIKKRDLNVNRPHSRLVTAGEIAQVMSVTTVIVSRGIAIYNRRKAGLGLLDRHTSSRSPQVLAGAVAGVPIAAAIQIRQLRRGTTLFRKHPITTIGKVQGTIRLSYAVFTGGAAAVELYRTREAWLPELKQGIGELKAEATYAILKRKLKHHAPVVAPKSEYSSLDELVLSIATFVVEDMRQAAKNPGAFPTE